MNQTDGAREKSGATKRDTNTLAKQRVARKALIFHNGAQPL